MYGKNLKDRGVKVNFYQIDDGWDNVDGNPVWSFNHKSLPNEFKELKNTANEYSGNLGVWMSPFGGYSGQERRINANIQNYQITSSGFTLGDERYFNRFRDQTINMIKNQGVNAFKFDGVGVGLRQNGAPNSYLKEYESLLNLLSELRTVSPDVYIYCTVGTWASPYWLWYCDSVWRDEEDQGLSGESKYPGNKDSKGFDDRERWITYRDSAIRKHNAIENPFMTINELMTHGFTYSTYSNYVFNNDLTNADVKNSILNDMKMLFALGGSLEELHIQKDQMDGLNND